MSQDQLKVVSVTGVDVEFRIAGPGSRSYAFVIDWHIRALLAVAWFVVSLLLINASWSLTMPPEKMKSMAFIVVLPATLIYFFYHPILEIATRGRTPGKRMAGVRIMTREGDIPGVGALLIRNLFRLVDSMPVFYVVGLVTTLVTAQHVRIGDLAAGTLLIVDDDREAKSLEHFGRLSHSHLDPPTADLIDELLQRWKILSPDHRRSIAANLLSRVENGDVRTFHSMHESELQGRLRQALKGKSA